MKPRRSSPSAKDATPSGPVVLDSSALLAFLRREPGAEIVGPKLKSAKLSTVNYCEVLAKSAEIGLEAPTVRALLDDLEVERVEFSEAHAMIAAALRAITHSLGLSLGDRACLALGVFEQATVLTADRIWANSPVGVLVKLIR